VALSTEIELLRDRVLTELGAAHDYYNDTKLAWDIVQRAINAGHTFSVQNLVTGTITSDVDLAARIRGYVAGQLTEATFQQFVAILENFLFEFLQLWLY
jgi:hypothetical protein